MTSLNGAYFIQIYVNHLKISISIQNMCWDQNIVRNCGQGNRGLQGAHSHNVNYPKIRQQECYCIPTYLEIPIG